MLPLFWPGRSGRCFWNVPIKASRGVSRYERTAFDFFLVVRLRYGLKLGTARAYARPPTQFYRRPWILALRKGLRKLLSCFELANSTRARWSTSQCTRLSQRRVQSWNSERYVRLASNARKSSLHTPECKFSNDRALNLRAVNLTPLLQRIGSEIS